MTKVIKKSLPKVVDLGKINLVRKKDGFAKIIRRTKPLKSLSSKLSNGIKKTKIRVIGIGGGGGNIVSELAQRVKRASFFAANTDLQALKKISKKVKIFPFGQHLTQGLGTGMDPELAERAAIGEKERIKKLLEGQDLVILVASLGGGTGSGAIPIFAKISKNLGNLTYGIFTLPFDFEGEKKKEIARATLEKVKSKLNVLTIIPNERIFQIIERTMPLKEALSFINKNLALSLGNLIEIIYQPGLINIDFADLKTVLEGQGRFAYLNTVEASSAEEKTEVIKKVLNNPLYPYTVKGSRGVLFNISGEKDLLLSEVSKISKAISELVNPEAKIIFGLSQAKVYQDKIQITLLATGCAFRILGDKIRPVVLKKRYSLLRKKRSAKILTEKTPEIKKEPEKLLKIKSNEKKLSIQKKKKKPKKPERTLSSTPISSNFHLTQQKKIKVEISKEPETKDSSQSEEKEKLVPVQVEEKPGSRISTGSPWANKFGQSSVEISLLGKIRKNALQIKKEIEETEREILEKEKFWETPAFLRRKKK